MLDRSLIRGMVEDYWRSMIPAMQRKDTAFASEIAQRFEKTVGESASIMSPLERAAFLQAVEAERERIVHEYKSNPGALKKRLGLPLGVDASPWSGLFGRR